MDIDEIKVYYPAWMKVLGVLFSMSFFVFAIVFLWGLFYTKELTVADRILFTLLGIAFLYSFIISVSCFNYFNTVLVLTENGIRIHNKEVSTDYLWSDLSLKSNGWGIKLACKNGKTVGYFMDGLPNLGLLVDTFESKST